MVSGSIDNELVADARNLQPQEHFKVLVKGLDETLASLRLIHEIPENRVTEHGTDENAQAVDGEHQGQTVEYKAAGDGYIEATYILGNHYQFKDNEKAFEWYKKGAEAGHVLCMKELGGCYEYGRGTDQNKSLAAEWYERAAEKGDTSAMCGLSSLFCLDDKAKSFLWAKKAAEAGNAGGMDYLAQKYFNGSGVEKNIDLAIEWYRKAIKNGDTSGKLLFNDLGMEFQFGNNGREVNLSYAYQFYKLAAECENADGMVNAGYCISNGVGVEKDLNKAYEYFKQAADLGHWIGMSNLGWCYLYGNGVEKDIEKAIHWLTRAAEEGNNIWSMNRLTEIYGELDGHVNYEQAAKWFLELIKRDCDPNSGVYENSGYNKDLYAKIKNAVLNSKTEEEMMSSMSGGMGGSLLGGMMSFTTSNAKSYINQAEETIQRNENAKAAEAARKQAEAEEARRQAEEQARREKEEAERREREIFEKYERDYAPHSYCGERWNHELNDGSIIIPEGVTRIGNAAFAGCNSLTSITIPNSVTSIGDSAFSCCFYLKSVKMGNGVKSMGEDIFRGCKIEKFDIPAGVTSIGEMFFYGCGELTSVNIPDSVTSIGDSAFSECKNLSSIVIPEGVTIIGSQAFRNTGLTAISFSDSVTSIGDGVFLYCKSLKGVKFGKNVISIGKGAFDNGCNPDVIIVPKGTKQRFERMEGLKGLESKIVEE